MGGAVKKTRFYLLKGDSPNLKGDERVPRLKFDEPDVDHNTAVLKGD